MAFYKKQQQPVNKLWYPRSILVGSPISTDEVAGLISAASTVSRADVVAVLTALGDVMGNCMAQGRSVKLDGIGTFSFTASAAGNGVKTPEEVTVRQIKGVKVHFVPETSYRREAGVRRAVRGLTNVKLEWVDIDTLKADSRLP